MHDYLYDLTSNCQNRHVSHTTAKAMQWSVCRGRPLCLPGGRAPTGGRPYRRIPLDNWRTDALHNSLRDLEHVAILNS
jgi:hypothetical protein